MDFEPVPWLAKEVDLQGSIFLRAAGYQLVGLHTRLNRIPSSNRVLAAYTSNARFNEIVSGVPVLAEWELTNVMSNNAPGVRPNGQSDRREVAGFALGETGHHPTTTAVIGDVRPMSAFQAAFVSCDCSSTQH